MDAPTHSLEPSEIAIRGDQFTAVFDGQGRYIGIGDQRALNSVAHFHKQVSVCATRHDEDGSWPLDEPAAKCQRCLHWRRRPKDLGICHGLQEASEHDLRDRERFRRLDQGSKPRRVSIVLGRVLPMRRLVRTSNYFSLRITKRGAVSKPEGSGPSFSMSWGLKRWP